MRLSLRAVSMFVLFLLFGTVGSVRAQSVETPTPFDSAHRVLSVTPPLAARSLQLVIDSAMTASGHPSSGVDLTSEPAGNSFARRQLLEAAVVYGPLAASLASDAQVAGALYLATTGATFFISYSAAQSENITQAQSHLAADMGLGAGAAGWLIGYGATGNSGKGVRTLALASALTGTISGAALGRSLTDAEAHSAWGGIQAGAATAWSATTVAGFSSRSSAVAIVGGEAIGYAIGVHYPQRAGYTVTAGDVDAVQTAGLIGALTSGAFFGSNNHPSHKQFAATLGPGYLAGIMIGDLAISRPLDLTTSDATLGNVGAVAGGLIGLALPVLAGSNSLAASMGLSGAGAAIGMAGILAATRPEPAVMRTGASRRSCSFGVVGVGVGVGIGYGCRF